MTCYVQKHTMPLGILGGVLHMYLTYVTYVYNVT